MIKPTLAQAVSSAIHTAMERGMLPRVDVPEVVVERTTKAGLGDYTTNAAMRLQKAVQMPPQRVAGAITHHLELPGSVAAVEVAGPGFINFTLSDEWLQEQVNEIVGLADGFGGSAAGNGASVQVEFVSANPTGPLHVGAARNAALGDSLANVLSFIGYSVQREYYINDAGSQTAALARSVFARYQEQAGQEPIDAGDGYVGEYVTELAQDVFATHGTALLGKPLEEALAVVGAQAESAVMQWIERDLADLGVRFDRWFSERSLFQSGLYDQVMAKLREGGYVVERDGATWFTAAELGENRENVLVRSNGQPTYFASDIAYHYDKLVLRGFDRVIDVWAADHHGHVPRMKSVARAFGIDPDRLHVLLYQLVKLFKDGQELKMSKRAGTYVTVRELVDDVGRDAARFFLVSRSADVTMNFDMDLARQQSDENPVFYVQYAHARICSILRRAEDLDWSGGDVSRLVTPAELTLIRKMLQLPEVVETAAEALAPHQLPFYAQELATVFHAFYRDCRVVTEDEALTRARLKLVAACRYALANALRLIGVSAPERM